MNGSHCGVVLTTKFRWPNYDHVTGVVSSHAQPAENTEMLGCTYTVSTNPGLGLVYWTLMFIDASYHKDQWTSLAHFPMLQT